MASIIKIFDRSFTEFMRNHSVRLLRLSLAIIFLWFGILKPLGKSPAEPLIKATMAWVPIFDPSVWLNIIGWWEVAIGILFLFNKTTKLVIGLLLLQMIGTFLPLFILPDVTFQNGNILLPTTEGQYILKNLMIISSALVIGGITLNSSIKE